MTDRLFCEIPLLRVAIITHGDYCDGDKVISQLDFTTDQQEIKNFIQNAPSTSGGDYLECYELVLRNVKSLSWNLNATMKSMILIGDTPSHEKDMLQAICFKQYNIEYLKQFEKELQEGTSGMSNAMRLMSDTMLGKKTREQSKEEMHPKRFNERYHRTSISTKTVLKSSKSAKPLLEYESELVALPPSRFQVF